MAVKTHTKSLGTGLVPVKVLAPANGIRFFEGIRLTMSGWFDAIRYRSVPDKSATHSAHRIMREFRGYEAKVVKGIDEGISLIDVQLARLSPMLEQEPVAPVESPSRSDLASMTGKERTHWAREMREAKAHNAFAKSRAQQVEATAAERAALLVERRSIIAEGEDVRVQWREAYYVRAARYTRARFGLFGARPDIENVVPAYEFNNDPYIDREATVLALKAAGTSAITNKVDY